MTFQALVFVQFTLFKKIVYARCCDVFDIFHLAITILLLFLYNIRKPSLVVISFLRARLLFTASNYYFGLTANSSNLTLILSRLNLAKENPFWLFRLLITMTRISW